MDSHADTIEKQKERIRDLQTEREAASSEASTAKEQVALEIAWRGIQKMPHYQRMLIYTAESNRDYEYSLWGALVRSPKLKRKSNLRSTAE